MTPSNPSARPDPAWRGGYMDLYDVQTIRRWDILRWKTADGKMLANTVLNVTLSRFTGTLLDSPTKDSEDPTMRATITPGKTEKIEGRTFKDYNRYLPIPQSARDKNPNLDQNPGYDGAK